MSSITARKLTTTPNLVDDADRDLPDGSAGELLVRARGPDPRQGFFSGYLDDDEATQRAWRGGWFHTGDVVTRDAGGMLYFVDRRKDMIRRSGENISAGEVEAVLAAHPAVARVAVLAVPDEMRDEEVLAVVVPAAGHAADEARQQVRNQLVWCGQCHEAKAAERSHYEQRVGHDAPGDIDRGGWQEDSEEQQADGEQMRLRRQRAKQGTARRTDTDERDRVTAHPRPGRLLKTLGNAARQATHDGHCDEAQQGTQREGQSRTAMESAIPNPT